MAGGSCTGPDDAAATAYTPWLFDERSLRTQLSSLYAAMVASTGNARLLIDKDPADVRREDAEGGDTVKDWLDEACRWLDEARIVCSVPSTFNDALLECVRTAARYLVEVRAAGASTALFDSWVFGKSAPQDAGADKRTVISAVVPSLETCMSVRVQQGVAAGISHGFYRLGPATPMPLTNRLHFVGGAGAVSLQGGAPDLADWNFLKVSPSDLPALSGSIEMDGYCEIASAQDGLRQRLGAPVILPGTVERLDDHSVVIGGLGGEEVSAVRRGGVPAEPDGLPRGGDTRLAAGKHGRFLVAAWYQPKMPGGGRGAAAPRRIELLYFEACGRDEAALDDMIGYVRMRGRAGAARLRGRYGGACTKIAAGAACLAWSGGAVVYRRARGGAVSPVREFLGAVDSMRAGWSRCRAGCEDGGLPAAFCDIVSEEGADIEALSSWAGRGGSARRTLLADIQDEFDRTGWSRGELEGGGGGGSIRAGGTPRFAASLERQGLLSRGGRGLSLSDKGQRVLAASFRQDAKAYLSERHFLYLPEAESRIPASVLLRHLKDEGDFEKAEWPRGKNSLLWVRRKGKGAGAVAAADLERCEALLADHHQAILDCARTVNHEINARFVRGELEKRGRRVAFLHVSIMLEQLERAGRLKAAGDSGSWRYPLRGRILDTMRADRGGAWRVDGILEATKVARNDVGNVGKALESLEADGLIVGLEDGVWGCREEGIGETGQRRQRAAALAKKIVLGILQSKKSGMDTDRLVGEVGGHLSRQFSRNQVAGLKQIARDAVSCLVNDGTVLKGDGMLRLGAQDASTGGRTRYAAGVADTS